MKRIAPWFVLTVSALCLCLTAQADWPTYQHDIARSGSTDEPAPRDPGHAWTYTSPTRPVPAWDEPALWDGWGKVYDLKNRQVFDKALHVAVVGGRVYFGSSVDDQVHCLDANTGESIWTHFTEGPVRLAPSVVEWPRLRREVTMDTCTVWTR